MGVTAGPGVGCSEAGKVGDRRRPVMTLDSVVGLTDVPTWGRVEGRAMGLRGAVTC
jgi:hypothetical protein